MLLKLVAQFAVAVTLIRPLPNGRIQWIYKTGPNQGYVCAIVEPDGPRFDVYIASIEAGVYLPSTTALSPVPWVSQPTEAAALEMVKSYCPTK